MDPYAPFRSPDYRRLLLGSFLTSFGLQMVAVAASWDLYLATKSALVLGNVGLVQVAPFIAFALFAGHIADRYERRHILVICQVVLLLASAILLFSQGSVVLIYACLFLTAAGRAFQGPARSAMLPDVVPVEALGRAVTWNSSGQEIANVSGPALAGLLVATLGSQSAYAVQLGCALVALVCFGTIGFRSAKVARPAVELGPRSLLDGMRFVVTNKLILSAMSLDLFAVLFGGAVALLPIYAVEILHVGAQGMGWLRAAPSVGAVGMAVLQAHMPRVRNAGKALLWVVAGFGAATIVFGFSRWLPLSSAMLVLTGVFDNVSVVLRQSLVQTRTPGAVLGRVSAVNNIFISCSNQLGAVESGWTAALFGAVPSVVAGGFATIAIAAGFAAWARSLRVWKQ